jgi:putative phage-type endonuclease
MVTAAPIASYLPYPPVVCTNREDWLQARRRSIGASESAAIFGLGYSSQSPLTVWASKVYGEDDFQETARMKIGKLIEPALRTIFADQNGIDCESPGEFSIYRHPDLPYMGATLDGLAVHPDYGPVPVEMKNVDFFNRAEWEAGTGPLKYQIQVQHQLAVTGASHAYLFGLIGGNSPVSILVERNERFINETLLPKLESFWGYVTRQEMPPVDGSEATAKLLKTIWPRDNGVAVMLPAESVEWDRELVAIKQTIKDAEARKTLLENQIKAAIGEATFGEIPGGGRYRWKEQVSQIKAVEAHERVSRVLLRMK